MIKKIGIFLFLALLTGAPSYAQTAEEQEEQKPMSVEEFCSKLKTDKRVVYNISDKECLEKFKDDIESVEQADEFFSQSVRDDTYDKFMEEYAAALEKQPQKQVYDCKPGVLVETCTSYFNSDYTPEDFVEELAEGKYELEEKTRIALYRQLGCSGAKIITPEVLQDCASDYKDKKCVEYGNVYNSCYPKSLTESLEDTLTQNEDLVYREKVLSTVDKNGKSSEVYEQIRDMSVNGLTDDEIMAIDKSRLEDFGYSAEPDTAEARRKLLKEMVYEDFSKILTHSSASVLNDAVTKNVAIMMTGLSLPADSFYIKSGYFDLLDKYKFSAGCFACPLFEIFFDTINDISMGIDRVLTPFLKILLAIGLAFWMLWQILKNVAIFSKKGFASFGQFVTLFSRGLFRGLVAAALLSVGLKVAFHYTLEPVVEFSTIYATEVMNVSKNRIKLSQAIDPSLSKSLESVDPCAIGRKPKETKGPFSRDIYNSFNCFLRTTSWSLAQGFAFGQYVLELVFSSQENGGFWIWKAFYSLRYLDVMLSGFFILISFFALMVLIPFKLMNVLIDFAVVTALFPIFVVAWVFPFTQKAMTKKAFDLFIGACFQLIVISVLLVLGVDFMVTMLGVDVNEFMEDVFKNDKETLEILRTKISVLYTSAPYLLLGAMFIVVKMLGLSNTLSSSIVSGSSNDMGGTMLGKTFKSIVLPYAAAKSIRDDFHKKQKEEEAKKKKGSTP
ncbi:MAG: hypothetical protein EOM53_01230 [Alphaproteobacteria bacterium]|nr:hypothetical protein [Alphaproteobacteria bacterium]